MSEVGDRPREAVVAAIPVAGRHRPGRDALLSVLVALAGAVNVVAVVFLSSGEEAFEAGRRNADPPFVFGQAETVALLLWGISGLALVAFAVAGPLVRRWFARGALLVCVAAVPMGCYTRPFPGERYDEGFRYWAAEHVPVDAVRRWGATLPVVAVATPGGATQLPGGQGVVLEWGVVASWGTARWVVVCASPTVAPPVEEHFLWKQVGDGVYAAFQVTN